MRSGNPHVWTIHEETITVVSEEPTEREATRDQAVGRSEKT